MESLEKIVEEFSKVLEKLDIKDEIPYDCSVMLINDEQEG
jgi:hypothetical protein